MCNVICLPGGLVQELTLVLLPLKLSGLEQLPTQYLWKEYKDMYYPTGEGMMERVSSRQTKTWEGEG